MRFVSSNSEFQIGNKHLKAKTFLRAIGLGEALFISPNLLQNRNRYVSTLEPFPQFISKFDLDITTDVLKMATAR